MLKLKTFVYNGFSENTYLIINEKKECWVVDPGMYDEQETQQFTNYIETEKLSLKGIINTHAHIDHIFGIPYLMDKYGLSFGIHQKDMQVLSGAKGAAMMFGFRMDQAPTPTHFIKEGETLMLGDDALEVRFTPGHSPGSIVFYHKTGNWVIGGDVLFSGGIGRTDLPGGHHQTLLDSINSQLFTLPNEVTVHPGHGPTTTIGEEKESNPFLK